jgi:deoxyribonuclease-4
LKVWLGPAGVPISSKEKSTISGIKTVSDLGLDAMEVEFVRGVKMSLEMAREAGELSQRLNIRLSIHAPYYINLCSVEKEKVIASKQRIIESVKRAHAMNADIVVFHPGYYQRLSKEEAYHKVKKACEDMRDVLKEKGISDVGLGLETTGKVSQFGTLDEIIQICKELKYCSPVVDWAHLYARAAGKINFSDIFDKVSLLKLDHLHTHFSCIEFSSVDMKGMGNERRHLTLNTKKPDFEPLVKEILKRKIDITLISESPILEQDALIMKKMFERHGYKF